MRLRSCGLIFAMLTGVQDALGGSLPSGCGVICGDSDVGDCASSHNGTPSSCTDEDVLCAPFKSQGPTFSLQVWQESVKVLCQRGLIKGTAIQQLSDRPTTFRHDSFSLRTWTKHGPTSITEVKSGQSGLGVWGLAPIGPSTEKRPPADSLPS